MRSFAAGCAAVAFMMVSLLTGCDRSAPDIIDPSAAGSATVPALLPAGTPGPTAAAQTNPNPTAGASGTPAAAAPANSIKYTIQPGDTLASIAARFNTTVDVIRSLNNLQGDLIVAGQTLIIPTAQPTTANPTTAAEQPTKAAPVQPPASPTRLARQTTYVVRSGDNLYIIAARFNVPLRALLRANGLSNPNAIIRVGQVLVIPASN